MRPKEYFEQSSIQEDKRYIFALIPTGFEEQYRRYIKEPLERVKIDGSITCESNLDLENDTHNLEETWKRIQRACIIIADVTGFQPGVMWQLGVAMMKKGRVILIAEKSAGEAANPPFDIHSLGIEFYEPGNLDVFSMKLVDIVKKILPTNHVLLGHEFSSNSKPGKPPDRIASPKALYQPGPPASGREFKIIVDKSLPGKQIPRKFEKKYEDWENSVEMYAQVKDIDDEQGFVYLNCKYKKDSDETFERIFPLKHFKNKTKLEVDQSILVQVYEKPGEVRFLFEEVDEDFFDQNLEDFSINDLKDSPIFKPL